MDDDWFEAAGGGAAVDVVALLDGSAGDALHALVDTGALVSLGLSRDRGALSVTVTVDGRWRRTWVRSADDLTEWASEALPHVRSAVERVGASSGRGTGNGARRGR